MTDAPTITLTITPAEACTLIMALGSERNYCIAQGFTFLRLEADELQDKVIAARKAVEVAA